MPSNVDTCPVARIGYLRAANLFGSGNEQIVRVAVDRHCMHGCRVRSRGHACWRLAIPERDQHDAVGYDVTFWKAIH